MTVPSRGVGAVGGLTYEPQQVKDKEAGRPYPGAGNVLCALGLICYTEFLGSFITGKANDPLKNFEAFLGEMGECYRDAIKEDGHRVWNFYRNGLVHEYALSREVVKSRCLRNGDSCGLWKAADGGYFLVVQRYYDDFMSAANVLYEPRTQGSSASQIAGDRHVGSRHRGPRKPRRRSDNRAFHDVMLWLDHGFPSQWFRTEHRKWALSQLAIGIDYC